MLIPGLILFSQILGSHRGLMGASGIRYSQLASVPHVLPHSHPLLFHMGDC